MLYNLQSLCNRVLITALIVVLRIAAWIILAACATVLALNLPGMFMLATGRVQSGDPLAFGDIAMSMPQYWCAVGGAVAIIIDTILIESLGVHFLHKLRARLIL
jgi:hypothetical protein